MTALNETRLDKQTISIQDLSEPSDEKQYWLARTPQERLEAVETMRQIIYGYDPSTTRLQRIFEVTQRP